jgi:CRISPR-associated protein Cas2
MPDKSERNYLIGYDIADPRRLHRVHRLLMNEAVPVQYSVFVTRASGARISRIVRELEKEIDRRADDVRIYLLPPAAEVRVFGRKALPDGISLLSGKSPALIPFGSGSDVEFGSDTTPERQP